MGGKENEEVSVKVFLCYKLNLWLGFLIVIFIRVVFLVGFIICELWFGIDKWKLYCEFEEFYVYIYFGKCEVVICLLLLEGLCGWI